MYILLILEKCCHSFLNDLLDKINSEFKIVDYLIIRKGELL